MGCLEIGGRKLAGALARVFPLGVGDVAEFALPLIGGAGVK